jgi:hypothetical protein
MFKSVKKFICNLFNIKECKCDDEVFLTGVPTPKPTHCNSHTRFIKGCADCAIAVK